MKVYGQRTNILIVISRGKNLYLEVRHMGVSLYLVSNEVNAIFSKEVYDIISKEVYDNLIVFFCWLNGS